MGSPQGSDMPLEQSKCDGHESTVIGAGGRRGKKTRLILSSFLPSPPLFPHPLFHQEGLLRCFPHKDLQETVTQHLSTSSRSMSSLSFQTLYPHPSLLVNLGNRPMGEVLSDLNQSLGKMRQQPFNLQVISAPNPVMNPSAKLENIAINSILKVLKTDLHRVQQLNVQAHFRTSLKDVADLVYPGAVDLEERWVCTSWLMTPFRDDHEYVSTTKYAQQLSSKTAILPFTVPPRVPTAYRAISAPAYLEQIRILALTGSYSESLTALLLLALAAFAIRDQGLLYFRTRTVVMNPGLGRFGLAIVSTLAILSSEEFNSNPVALWLIMSTLKHRPRFASNAGEPESETREATGGSIGMESPVRRRYREGPGSKEEENRELGQDP
ncbi:hypothetical protein NMY22_g8916 [Coprinellus aureogranulatus]|nr:hypothetical protein NMY22_g8916 [Coprinellus aureogranulatus]